MTAHLPSHWSDICVRAALLVLALALPTWCAEPAPEQTPPADPTEAADDDGIPVVSVLDKKGKVNRAVYIREATTYTAQALSRRLGPDYAYFRKEQGKEQSKESKGQKKAEQKKADSFPDVWLRPDLGSHKNPTGYESPYQIGTWTSDPGGFSSSVTQALYLPTMKNDHGVDRIYLGGNANGCYWQKPYFWPPGGSHPEPAMNHAPYNQMAGGFLDKPIAQTRGYGLWTNCSLMVFQNGMLAIGGSNTSQERYPTFQFPSHKIPTAITLTPQNEFALVTIWDVKELKGQVAVLAMESGYADGDGLMALYSWHEAYPGLCNVGGFRFIKLLGYVDLPGMYAPTAISSWCNARWWGGHLSNKEGLLTQASRDKWRNGLEGKSPLEYQGGATTGYAVVASRSENKIVFIELRPLFQQMAKMYFTTAENFAKTRDIGLADKQWPYTFEVAPESRPNVSPPITVKQPTAVACSLFGSSGSWFGHQSGRGCRTYVACMDGTLKIFATDALADDTPAGQKVPLAQVGVAKVGRNPCWITYDRTLFSSAKNSIWVVSRGDRSLQRLLCTGDTAESDLTIRDQRLLDPVCADVSDNHSNGGKILIVCDFAGMRLTGYRYEKVTLTTKTVVGMGPEEKDLFECTGSLELPGYPFSISASNVN